MCARRNKTSKNKQTSNGALSAWWRPPPTATTLLVEEQTTGRDDDDLAMMVAEFVVAVRDWCWLSSSIRQSRHICLYSIYGNSKLSIFRIYPLRIANFVSLITGSI
jgi:hypothetical protein